MVIGAGFISFISEYATYWFSISHGVRIPVESVPYLSVTITLLSIAILTSFILALALIIAYFKFIDYVFNNFRSLLQEIDKDKKPASIISLIGSVFSFASLVIAIFNIVDLERFGIGNDFVNDIKIYIIVIITIVYFTSLIRISDKVKLSLLVIVLAGQVFITSGMLFNRFIYGEFLRISKLGGGIEVSLHFDKEKTMDANLFMITKKKFILYSKHDKKFMEIPRSKVEKYSYSKTSNWFLL